MEVTGANFDAAANELESLLPSAEFVAVDEEMTGIVLDRTTQPNPGDTTESRYQKMKCVVKHFNLMQVGICTFHRSADGGLVARPFNFYVLADPKSAHARLTMDVSTVEFHRANGMDWTKWLNASVPFMSSLELAAQVAKVDEDLSAHEAKPRVELSREADKEFVATAMAGVAAWRAALIEKEEAGDAAEAEGAGETGAAEYVLPECNGFLRRALHERLEDFGDLVGESRPIAPDAFKKQLHVMRLTPAQRAARVAERRQAKIDDLHARAGFLRVFRMLCAAKKPLVGHNLTYDLLFLVSSLHGPLPPTLREYKAIIHDLFPQVWDTKLTATLSGRFSDTMLARLHEACLKVEGAPAVALADGFDSYASGARCHEAGYDAYITGVCHAALAHVGAASERRLNRCYLMRSLLVLNLSGADELGEPATVVLHLSFESPMTTPDLVALFTPLFVASQAAEATEAAEAATGANGDGAVDRGGNIPSDASSIAIKWINGSSALAVLPLGLADGEGAAAAALEEAGRLGVGVRPVPYATWLDEEAAREDAARAHAEEVMEDQAPSAASAAVPAASIAPKRGTEEEAGKEEAKKARVASE